jgi:mannose-6-phosphate isomerase-like protein (cupin superfamily)
MQEEIHERSHPKQPQDSTKTRLRIIFRELFIGGRLMKQVILKRFEVPDEIISFEKGRFEKITLGGVTIGRATYEPGWKWSTHIGSKTGATLCQVEHVGLVVSGRATAAMQDGSVIEMRAGDLFYIPPGHDSWVLGDENYVSLHFLGAEKYAR